MHAAFPFPCFPLFLPFVPSRHLSFPLLLPCQLRMPGGLDVRTRVTRRSQVDKQADSRIETSEYMEQVGSRVAEYMEHAG